MSTSNSSATGSTTFSYENFKEILRIATAEINSLYLDLPVAGQDDSGNKERVYAYELYHQLRVASRPYSELDVAPGNYIITAEVPKRAHPATQFHGDAMGEGRSPDLLVHRAGQMGLGRNLVVIEVKPISRVRPITGQEDEIRKDLEVLTAFRHRNLYNHAIFLLFGGNESNIDLLRQKAHDWSETPLASAGLAPLPSTSTAPVPVHYPIDLSCIDLYWHPAGGVSATLESW